MPSSHDQNFKNLILDYPRQAIELFAPNEAEGLSAPGVRYLPVREEQLKERLGERFRELDTPVLVEWPDRRREALLFLFRATPAASAWRFTPRPCAGCWSWNPILSGNSNISTSSISTRT